MAPFDRPCMTFYWSAIIIGLYISQFSTNDLQTIVYKISPQLLWNADRNSYAMDQMLSFPMTVNQQKVVYGLSNGAIFRLSVCSSVCLSPKFKKRDFVKTKQFRAMVSINDLQEVVHGLFKEPITEPLKSKMAEIRHLGSLHQNEKTAIFSKIKQFRAMVSIDDLQEFM